MRICKAHGDIECGFELVCREAFPWVRGKHPPTDCETLLKTQRKIDGAVTNPVPETIDH